MRERFISAIKEHREGFGVHLSDEAIQRLADYYELVEKHNPLLHLVAPCTPEEFASRHILESLTLLEFLPQGARFADVGTGAGLPSIPCLIARDDVHAVLIESKEKKAGFLQTVLADCQLTNRAAIVNRQFSETPRPDVSYVTSRALDRFTENLLRLVKWSRDCKLLFFGGPALEERLTAMGLSVERRLLPMSEQRFLFVTENRRRQER